MKNKNYDKIKEKINKQMIASLKNVVFVNFKKDLKYDLEPFGQKDLFKKLNDAFIETEEYKFSEKDLSQEEINNKIEGLKKS